MRTFSCHCGNRLHFENSVCFVCGRTLAYLKNRRELAGLDPAGDGWWVPAGLAPDTRYRLCANYTDYQVCNWAIEETDPNRYCQSCRLNHTIPNLTDPKNLTLWYRIEVAKRRLLYTLDLLGLPVLGRDADPEHGLAFEFLADPAATDEFVDEPGAGRQVLTGHRTGIITINIGEAQQSQIENMRERMSERYRTLLGHFRHESGHYFWEVLVRNDPARLTAFRELFGDERDDYARALQRHYQRPPSARHGDWISHYASAHPWEDWAETWAHYLHMIDTLETAHDYSLSLGELPMETAESAQAASGYLPFAKFDETMRDWAQLTVALNALNRSMGLADAYPFAPSETTTKKLRFVHDCIHARQRAGV